MKEKIIESVSQFVSHIEGLNDQESFWYRGVSRTNNYPAVLCGESFLIWRLG